MSRKIFDVHNHVGSLTFSSSPDGGEAFSVEEDYRRRVEMMDRFGITKAAVMPSLQYERPEGQRDTRRINDSIASYRRQYGARFPVAMGTVEPLHGEKNGLDELERIKIELGLDGVVWHHRQQGTYMADRRMRPFLRQAEALSLPAFVHLFAESALEASWGLEVLAEDFPGVTFVALGAFSGYTQTRYLLSIGKRFKYIMFETAGLFPLAPIIEEFVKTLGSERIIFGTDLYVNPLVYNVPQALYEIEASPITDIDKDNIFWNNACRLFKRDLAG